MFCVYLIRSKAFPGQRYVGFATDLRKRIATHNADAEGETGDRDGRRLPPAAPRGAPHESLRSSAPPHASLARRGGTTLRGEVAERLKALAC